MDLGLQGKIVIVCGASAGIGFESARAFVAEGANVAICSRNQASIEAAANALDPERTGRVLPVAADLSDEPGAAKLIDAVVARYSRIHVLINNVGGPRPGTFTALDDSAWQAAVDLTLMSAVRVTRLALPFMREQRWGRIVNVSSYSVKQPIPGLMLSNSVRMAMLGWAKTLANEVAADNVLVNTVCPGWTRTDRVQQIFTSQAGAAGTDVDAVEARIASGIPLGRLAEPNEIASAVAFLSSERASYLTGTALAVDGGAAQSYG
ncbi:SDR family oxidoreductase [Peristeroidobacter soli]|jgi:3-oxoacyl-[acyl-carrier protein] reductase|uniref:SDR family oxidoreductase n=1 Tax=Peristeroidobacter soli TaxID=2497877 RepID=UPI00101CAA30|nr:SDR family oxidoreductase [Peristeroidobacter soli]